MQTAYSTTLLKRSKYNEREGEQVSNWCDGDGDGDGLETENQLKNFILISNILMFLQKVWYQEFLCSFPVWFIWSMMHHGFSTKQFSFIVINHHKFVNAQLFIMHIRMNVLHNFKKKIPWIKKSKDVLL